MGLQQKTFADLVTFTRASLATFVGADKQLQEAQANQPRFDHDPVTGEPLGLLVEEARTNVAVPQTLNWPLGASRYNTTARPVTGSPIAGVPAFELLGSAATTTQYWAAFTVNTTSGVEYTYTVYLKAGTADIVNIFGSGTFPPSTGSGGSVNLTTGVVLSGDASIEAAGDGWYKITRQHTANATGGALYVQIQDADGSSTYTSDGTRSVYVVRPSVEAGAFPTSYITCPLTFTSRASTALYWDETGTIQEAAVDEARPLYVRDGSDVAPWVYSGLLYEGAVTNLSEYSASVAKASIWNTFGLTMTPAPSIFDGQLAWKAKGDGGTNRAIEKGAGTLIAGAQTISTVVEAGAATAVRVGIRDGVALVFIGAVTFTYSTETFSVESETQGVIVGYGFTKLADVGPNGGAVYRIWLAATADNAGNGARTFVYPNSTGASSAYTYIHHVQLEAGSAPTTPIITPVSFTSRASTANYFDASGVLQSAAVDESRPHYVYDPLTATWTGGALLYEAAGTNSLLHSRDLSNGVWTKANTTLAQNQTGLDGAANTAWHLTSTVGNGDRVIQTITIADDSATHTGSVFIRKDSDETRFPLLIISATGVAGVPSSFRFNTKTGAKSYRNGDASLHRVEDCGDWWRVSVGVANNSAGNTSLILDIYYNWSTTFGADVAAPAGGTIVIDFPQVELNTAQASSPIETTTAAVTRSADVVTSAAVTRSADVVSSTAVTRAFDHTYAQAAGVFNPAATTMVVEFDSTDRGLSSGLYGLFDFTILGSNGVTWDLRYNRSDGGMTTIYADVPAGVNYGMSIGPLMFDQTNKIAICFDVAASHMRWCINGGVAGKFTAVAPVLPKLAPEIMYIGNIDGSSSFAASDPIKSIKAYPYAMTDAELTAASTL